MCARRQFLLLFLTIGSLSCQTSEPYHLVNEAAASGRCEDALAALETENAKTAKELHDDPSWWDSTSDAVVSAAAITTDATFIVVGGVVVGAAVCIPTIALSMTTGARGDLCARGLAWGADISDPELRKSSGYGATQERNRQLGDAMYKIAKCNAGRGDKESLIKALTQIDLMMDGPVYADLSNKQKFDVDVLRADVDAKLSQVDPKYQEEVKEKRQDIDKAIDEAIRATQSKDPNATK